MLTPRYPTYLPVESVCPGGLAVSVASLIPSWCCARPKDNQSVVALRKNDRAESTPITTLSVQEFECAHARFSFFFASAVSAVFFWPLP
jgi:hypothetical protein